MKVCLHHTKNCLKKQKKIHGKDADKLNQCNKVNFMNTFEKIYEVVKSIPKGKVATYGQVAFLAGNPHWSRVVGYALHKNPDSPTIPCHRVVNREGKVAHNFAFGGSEVQRQLLEAEGVIFESDGRIDLEKYGM